MNDLGALIGAESDVVVIAEAGVNHNGSEELARELIDAASVSGAQFVKFQTFDPASLVAPNASATPYQRDRGASSQTELLQSLVLPGKAWLRLRDHAESRGIGFLSTPFDMVSAKMLLDLGVDGIKVSSGELTNHPFLNELATLGVPMLVSTGMGTGAEVHEAVAACDGAPFLALFHCVSAYPAPEEDCNLRAIPALRSSTGVPVGWSDHTTGIESALLAAALGSRLFEKHLTLDRSMVGPDHQASLEPDELRDYVERLSAVPAMLGDGVKRRMPSEEENAPLVRRSWHAARTLRPGEVIERGDVVALRPEDGIVPVVDIVGRVVATEVQAFAALRDDALEAL